MYSADIKYGHEGAYWVETSNNMCCANISLCDFLFYTFLRGKFKRKSKSNLFYYILH